MSYSLSDLGTAFRKAKVDLYSTTNPSLFAIADYEENLKRLQKKINGRITVSVKDPGFLDTWTLISRSFDLILQAANLGQLNTHKYTYGVTGIGLKYIDMLWSAHR